MKNEHQLLFITCSWNLEEDGKTAPNNYACLLSEYFSKDFSKCQPAFSIQILQAVASEFLSNQLYEEMDKSTIGLILMTRDIEGKDGKFYCKPNVYHELGYLMKHVGKEKLIIFREKDVFVPSNIQDIIRIEFDIDKMPLRFLDVVSRISEITDLDEEIFIRCMGNHIKDWIN
ncbi:MAG: nucleotide-binding protein [Bacteroidetes bacterium]|nr:nucleotide-binding protein [Bacteroidota bacterium]